MNTKIIQNCFSVLALKNDFKSYNEDHIHDNFAEIEDANQHFSNITSKKADIE